MDRLPHALVGAAATDIRHFGVNVGIASSSNGGNVRIKIMNQLGSRAIADSGADPLSSAGQAYAAMQKGTLSLPAGKYVVQVTRANDTLDSAKPNYTVQLSAGKSKNDYVTNEYVVDPNAPVNPNVQSSNLAAALTSLPPDGTQTTDIFTQTSMAGNYAGLNTYA